MKQVKHDSVRVRIDDDTYVENMLKNLEDEQKISKLIHFLHGNSSYTVDASKIKDILEFSYRNDDPDLCSKLSHLIYSFVQNGYDSNRNNITIDFIKENVIPNIKHQSAMDFLIDTLDINDELGINILQEYLDDILSNGKKEKLFDFLNQIHRDKYRKNEQCYNKVILYISRILDDLANIGLFHLFGYLYFFLSDIQFCKIFYNSNLFKYVVTDLQCASENLYPLNRILSYTFDQNDDRNSFTNPSYEIYKELEKTDAINLILQCILQLSSGDLRFDINVIEMACFFIPFNIDFCQFYINDIELYFKTLNEHCVERNCLVFVMKLIINILTQIDSDIDRLTDIVQRYNFFDHLSIFLESSCEELAEDVINLFILFTRVYELNNVTFFVELARERDAIRNFFTDLINEEHDDIETKQCPQLSFLAHNVFHRIWC